MPKFVITTRSTFENVYIIEAPDYTSAYLKVEDGDIDFFQQHLGEEIIKHYTTDKPVEEVIKGVREEGYW